jgi:hypothetical protein
MAKTHSQMEEGSAAFDRFRKAMKTIVSVPKSAVVPEQKSTKRKATKKR